MGYYVEMIFGRNIQDFPGISKRYASKTSCDTTLNDLDIQEGDKIEICNISEEGITSNIRTVNISDVSNNEFSFIDSKRYC